MEPSWKAMQSSWQPADSLIRVQAPQVTDTASRRELGLKVTDIAPSLVPLKTKEDYIPKLQGLSLKNTGLTIKNGKKVLYEDFGEMMFTHFGVTGPMILSASAHIGAKLAKAPNGELTAYLDLKPALTREQLDARVLREFEVRTRTNSLKM